MGVSSLLLYEHHQCINNNQNFIKISSIKVSFPKESLSATYSILAVPGLITDGW